MAFFLREKHDKCPTNLEKVPSSFSPTSRRVHFRVDWMTKKKNSRSKVRNRKRSLLSPTPLRFGSIDEPAVVTPFHPKGNILVLATQPAHSRNETVAPQPVRNHPIRSGTVTFQTEHPPLPLLSHHMSINLHSRYGTIPPTTEPLHSKRNILLPPNRHITDRSN